MLKWLANRFTGDRSPVVGDQRRRLGFFAERLAVRHLRRLGYRILERNLRMGYGELDVVAKQGDTLVFCEVRARRGTDEGGDLIREAVGASIDPPKQKRLARLAAGYLQRLPDADGLECRFDVVLLWKRDGVWRVEVIADAFRPGW